MGKHCLECKADVIATETYLKTTINVCADGHRTGTLTALEVKAIIAKVGDKPKNGKKGNKNTDNDSWNESDQILNLRAAGMLSAVNE